jgi:hypothetical protein
MLNPQFQQSFVPSNFLSQVCVLILCALGMVTAWQSLLDCGKPINSGTTTIYLYIQQAPGKFSAAPLSLLFVDAQEGKQC